MIDIEKSLRAAIPHELATALLAAYREIEGNYVAQKWKVSELDAGHFVEAARRIIEHRLFGTYTPLDKELSKFSEPVLAKYLSATGDESYRVLIPRVLWAIYGVRNKRGVGHLGTISPNEMDATLILYAVKWVLADILRIESGLSPEGTQKAIDQVIERQMPLLWKDGDIVRVATKGVPTRAQVLLFLYDSSPQAEDELRERCEYKSPSSEFRKILRRLHADKLIFLGPDSRCLLMPAGIRAAEGIVQTKGR